MPDAGDCDRAEDLDLGGVQVDRVGRLVLVGARVRFGVGILLCGWRHG
ncbi:hypothetical protein ACIQNV_36040 [Streptomyces hydrogenans]